MIRVSNWFHIPLFVCGIGFLAPSGVLAADAEEAASPWSVYSEAIVANDYIDRGITQTDHNPALQVWSEIAYDSLIYAAVFAANVNYGESDAEIDTVLGIRPTIGDHLKFDIAYYHYFYPEDTTPGFDEFVAEAKYESGPFTAGVRVWFAPDYSQSDTSEIYVEAFGEIPVASSGFTLLGGGGYQGFDSDYGESYLTWNAGVGYSLSEFVEFRVLYSDTDLSDDDCAIIATRENSCEARLTGSIKVNGYWPQ